MVMREIYGTRERTYKRMDWGICSTLSPDSKRAEESRKSEKTTSENRPIVTGLKRWWQVPPGIPETMDSPTNPTVSVFYGENVP